MSRRQDIASIPAHRAEDRPLSRVIRLDEIGDSEEVALAANEAERDVIAGLLDLAALRNLAFSGQLLRQAGGRILLKGTLSASVIQTCVVTLEPVANDIEVPVEVEFWPEEKLEAFGEGLYEAPGQAPVEWPEPIVEGKIDLGSLFYEVLATAIDPYPRCEDARLDWREEAESASSGPAPRSPFAVLERLKKRG